MDENNNQKQGFPIELNAETALGEYANLALISHSSSDFVIDFARMLPGMPKPQQGRSCSGTCETSPPGVAGKHIQIRAVVR